MNLRDKLPKEVKLLYCHLNYGDDVPQPKDIELIAINLPDKKYLDVGCYQANKITVMIVSEDWKKCYYREDFRAVDSALDKVVEKCFSEISENRT